MQHDLCNLISDVNSGEEVHDNRKDHNTHICERYIIHTFVKDI